MDLEGRTVAIIGRLGRLPVARLLPAVERLRISITRRAVRSADLTVLGHGATSWLRSANLGLTRLLRGSRPLLSEHSFLRRLGLMRPLGREPRPYSSSDVQRRTGAPADTLRLFTLFDLVEPEEGRFSFRDIKAVRGIVELLEREASLADAIERALDARRSTGFDRHLAALDLCRAPAAAPVLPLGDRPEAFETLWEQAVAAEEEGDYESAAALYRHCGRMRPRDTACLHGLAVALKNLGDDDEARTLLLQLTSLCPDLTDAWLELAEISTGDEKFRWLESALRAAPGSVPALQALALAYTEAERYADALPIWESLLAMAASDPEVLSVSARERARRAAALCRMVRLRSSPGGAR